ncbi:MAG: PIN domain-containing protein [Bacteroidota bacterium]
MNYLLDTNILLILLQKSDLSTSIKQQYELLAPQARPIISVVSIGEIESLAIQNKWGVRRRRKLKELLNQFIIADINVRSIIERYAVIDAFSQAKHPLYSSNFTSRNMGKNDLWIAATASVLDVKLLTADQDFLHLEDVFVDLELIERKK